MSRIRKLQIERMLPRLKEIRDTSTMENSDFGEDTGLILSRTELWRETWITGPLSAVIEDLEKEMNR